jgi:hypothetical protein
MTVPISHKYQFLLVYLSDLVIMSSLLDPRFTGSNPAEVNGFLKVIKICYTTSIGRELKPGVKYWLPTKFSVLLQDAAAAIP